MIDTANGKLTIVLPIHGRWDFVARFQALNLPFPSIDLPGPGWFAKIADGLECVATPYVMLADCDDFPQPRGLDSCIRFLDDNPDYVCASGRIRGVWIFPNQLTGPFKIKSRQYSPYDKPALYCADSVNDRVLEGFANSWSYYAVYRTEALRTIWQECVIHDFKDLMIHEKFCAMRCLTLGKAASFSHCTSLIRQYGTSQVAATRADWIKNYSAKEHCLVLDLMGELGVDRYALDVAWSQWYAERYKAFYGHPARKWLGRKFPFLRKLSPLLEIMR